MVTSERRAEMRQGVMKPSLGIPYTSIGPGLTPREIADGERRIGVAIPEAYRAFLRETNGAYLDDVVYWVAPSSRRKGVLHGVRVLAGIQPPGSGVTPEDLAGWHEYFSRSKPHVPAGSFVFAHAPSGSFIVFGEGEQAGHVHHVDREHGKRTPLTRSMEEFLARLRSRSDGDVVAAFPIAPVVYVVAAQPPHAPPRHPRAAERARPKTLYEDHEFRFAGLRARGAVRVQDVRAVDCTFVSCHTDPRAFATFEHIEIERVVCRSSALSNVICRHVTVDTCTVKGKPGRPEPFVVKNGLYDRVKLVGDFEGGVLLRTDTYRCSDAIKKRIATFYDDVEWALDIRGARFRALTLRGVPGHLVRRDPERHVLLRQDRLAADSSWRRWNKRLTVHLELALDKPGDWIFHIANDLSPRFQEQLADIAKLREAGFAE